MARSLSWLHILCRPLASFPSFNTLIFKNLFALLSYCVIWYIHDISSYPLLYRFCKILGKQTERQMMTLCEVWLHLMNNRCYFSLYFVLLCGRFPNYHRVKQYHICVKMLFVPLPPNNVREGIMFSGCPTAAYVYSSFYSSVHLDRSWYHDVS